MVQFFLGMMDSAAGWWLPSSLEIIILFYLFKLLLHCKPLCCGLSDQYSFVDYFHCVFAGNGLLPYIWCCSCLLFLADHSSHFSFKLILEFRLINLSFFMRFSTVMDMRLKVYLSY